MVYVYVYGDGNGQPNHNDQIAVLTINGREYGSPKTGENKYIVWEKNGCCPKTTGVHLDPGARYWVFVWAGRSDTGVIVDNTSGNKGGEADWRIEGARVKPEGSAYSKYTDEPTEMRIQVEGENQPRGGDLDQRRHGDRGHRRDDGLRGEPEPGDKRGREDVVLGR